MRTSYSVFHGLLSGLLVIACGKPAEGTGAGTETESSGSESSGGDPGTASNSGGPNCAPGQSVECTCTNGETGAQVCNPDGKAFGMCVCEGGGSVSNSDSNSTDPTTGVTTTTTGPDLTTGTTTEPDLTTTGDTTGTTTTGNVECMDPGLEPNDEEGDAIEFDDQSCQDAPGMFAGVLNGDLDVDWFRYRGVDGQGCGFNNPFVAHMLTASDTVRMCVFAECDQGEPQFQCPMGSQNDDSPDGLPGCCGTGDLTFQWNCQGSPLETADFYVRLDQAPADACVDYSVTYSYAPMG